MNKPIFEKTDARVMPLPCVIGVKLKSVKDSIKDKAILSKAKTIIELASHLASGVFFPL